MIGMITLLNLSARVLNLPGICSSVIESCAGCTSSVGSKLPDTVPVNVSLPDVSGMTPPLCCLWIPELKSSVSFKEHSSEIRLLPASPAHLCEDEIWFLSMCHGTKDPLALDAIPTLLDSRL